MLAYKLCSWKVGGPLPGILVMDLLLDSDFQKQFYFLSWVTGQDTESIAYIQKDRIYA